MFGSVLGPAVWGSYHMHSPVEGMCSTWPPELCEEPAAKEA